MRRQGEEWHYIGRLREVALKRKRLREVASGRKAANRTLCGRWRGASEGGRCFLPPIWMSGDANCKGNKTGTAEVTNGVGVSMIGLGCETPQVMFVYSVCLASCSCNAKNSGDDELRDRPREWFQIPMPNEFMIWPGTLGAAKTNVNYPDSSQTGGGAPSRLRCLRCPNCGAPWPGMY